MDSSGKGGARNNRRVIVCSNCLPLDVVRVKSGNDESAWRLEWNDDLLFVDGPMFKAFRTCAELEDAEVLFVGVPRTFIPVKDQPVVERLMEEMGCHPVFLEAAQAHNHFQGYCKGVLWPSFHNIIDLYSKSDHEIGIRDPVRRMSSQNSGSTTDSARFQRGWKPQKSWGPKEAELFWPDYCDVNRLHASKIAEVYQYDSDVVWIHDYPLLTMPSYIRRKIPNANIGLYLHLPFPSSEIFRTIGSREEILKCMLCADHIGFHLFEYARHFLACCKRILGLQYEAKQGGTIGVGFHGRHVSITCSHVGISVDTIQMQMNGNIVTTRADELYNRIVSIPNQFRRDPRHRPSLIVGIDELEGLQGISLKLLAFERLLSTYPSMRNGRVVLYQVLLWGDSRPTDALSSKEEALQIAKNINDTWGEGTVVLEEFTCGKEFSFIDRLATWHICDVLLTTHVRSGFNVLPLEYYLVKDAEPFGAVVLSEFSGCSRTLWCTASEPMEHR